MPRRNRETLRTQILGDPNTALIAKELDVPIEEYVETVLDFAMNPGKEPQFVVVPDEHLRAHGYEPPNLAEMERYLREAREMIETQNRSDYQTAKKKLVELPDEPSEVSRAKEAPPELKREVELRRRKGRPVKA